MTVAVLNHPFKYEVECLVRLFYHGEKITFTQAEVECDEDYIITKMSTCDSGTYIFVQVCLDSFNQQCSENFTTTKTDAQLQNAMGRLLFTLLCKQTALRPSWGILTGVRPVRLCQAMFAKGMTSSEIVQNMVEEFLVLPEKATLAVNTAMPQQTVLKNNSADCFSLYISIPFCPTRCHYCSFISQTAHQSIKLIPQYVELLCEEIRTTGIIAKKMGKKLQTIYMGGGTPTTLTPEQLLQVLQTVEQSFDLSALLEYTVEAGRPDTITREKLQVLHDNNVGRISINPQTMQDQVLVNIGRSHTTKQTVDSYLLAREIGFASINMDVIAGLYGDTLESFVDTMERVIALEPENITVHTLTVKRASTLRSLDGAFSPPAHNVEEFLKVAYEKLVVAGYFPYYLYRQKGTVQNLENTGFSKAGHLGIYNVYSMEEVHTILAVGAGAVTKLYHHDSGLINRIYNYKYPYEYCNGFEQILNRKKLVEQEKWSVL